MNIINTLHKIKLTGELIINNLVPIIFLLGLIIIDVGVFIGFGITIGLITLGIILVVISLILASEQTPPSQ